MFCSVLSSCLFSFLCSGNICSRNVRLHISSTILHSLRFAYSLRFFLWFLSWWVFFMVWVCNRFFFIFLTLLYFHLFFFLSLWTFHLFFLTLFHNFFLMISFPICILLQCLFYLFSVSFFTSFTLRLPSCLSFIFHYLS